MIRTCLFSIGLSLLAAGEAAACAMEKITLRGAYGAATFDVDLAVTPQERGQGLMFVEEMAEDRGMLFIFESPRALTFWMKNTLIPLDMIFITERGVVRHVHENAIPHDETTIPSNGPALAVLEINGGLSGEIGIAAGDLVQHPLLPQDKAALPCD
ncbi:DUF192 domain-containing protein [Primorskyibacter sp. S187A]|uniref:DUF192 domain-containing protein n=1 Tax=Primorskyibacter sp. S187A TaxID=3415130 RepID=UPI003C7AD94F